MGTPSNPIDIDDDPQPSRVAQEEPMETKEQKHQPMEEIFLPPTT
jgi:hypothetical protein